MASPNAQGKPINISSSPGLQPPSQLRTPRGSNAQRSDVDSEQLAEIRSAYEQFGSSPPVRNIPPPRSATASGTASPVAGRSYRPDSSLSRAHGSSAVSIRSNAVTQGASFDDLTDAQKARIVRKHLMNRGEQEAARRAEELGEGPSASSLVLEEEDEPALSVSGSEHEGEEYPMPFHLQGGDIHHELYKWHQKQLQQQAATGTGGHSRPGMGHMSHTLPDLRAAAVRGRAASVTTASRRGSDATSRGVAAGRNEDGEISYRDIMQPGGFRRAYIHQKRAAAGKRPLPDNGQRVTRSFVHFLTLYGHFGGEDLEEIDEEDEADLKALRDLEDMEEADGGAGAGDGDDGGRRPPNERTPLMRSKSIRKGKTNIGKHGDATVTQAVMMLLKSFVGTGVLFLGKAFFNGGILFSTCMLVFISLVSLYSFLLLVKTRLVVPGGFGEIGGILYGPWMRRAILFSIVLSQLGFVAAYTIFIAQNLQAFVMAVTDCKSYVPIAAFIFAQLIAYLPLAMIRNIQKLSWTALVADAFILVGLVYVFGNEIKVLADRGVADVKFFNPKSFPLLIGTAVFTFEGIGLVVPITESMKEPEKFPRVLTGVMLGITVLFAGAGALGYAAYGSKIQTVVIVNLPQEDRFVNVVQFLYSMAIMLSTPLQLFPAVRIMENGIFSASGKYSNKVKWQKNVFRTCTVTFCALIAWLGASDLDKFVSLIGSVACVPLCYCYPALLHLKARADTRRQKVADIILFLFGLAAALYTTIQTFILLASGGSSGPPQFGKCKPPT